MPEIDAAFTALPLRRLADAALSRARDLGADHADFRFERIRTQHLSLRDAPARGRQRRRGPRLRGPGASTTASGGSPRGVDLTPEAAERVAEQAVAVAQVAGR